MRPGEAMRIPGIEPYYHDEESGIVLYHAVRCARYKDAFPRTRGRVIATAVLSGCQRFDPNDRDNLAVHPHYPNEVHFGDFAPGRYGWLLHDVRRLPEPIPARGELGIWTWDAPEGLVAA